MWRGGGERGLLLLPPNPAFRGSLSSGSSGTAISPLLKCVCICGCVFRQAALLAGFPLDCSSAIPLHFSATVAFLGAQLKVSRSRSNGGNQSLGREEVVSGRWPGPGDS